VSEGRLCLAHTAGLDGRVVPRIREIRLTLILYIERRYEARINEASADPIVRFETALAIGALGNLHLGQGKPATAEQEHKRGIALWEALIRDYPANTAYWKQLGNGHGILGWMFEDQGRLGEAADEYRKAGQAFGEIMRLEPGNPKGWNNLACVLVESNMVEIRNPPRAIELAQRAIELAPRNRNYWWTLGFAYYQARDWSAAITALEKSRELSRFDNADNWFALAMAH
jgi:tetratricopeptide (TPR) repeat protein